MSEAETTKRIAQDSDISQQIKRKFQKVPVPKVLKGKTRFEAELLLNPHKTDNKTLEAKKDYEQKFEEIKALFEEQYSNVKLKLVEMKRPVFRDEPNFFLVLIADVELPLLIN